MMDKDHRPVIGGSAGPVTTGASSTMDKLKLKMMQGASAAPMKSKLMTVKLKPQQMGGFKSGEMKSINIKKTGD